MSSLTETEERRVRITAEIVARTGIDAVHFDHWFGLFEITAAESCPPAAAAHFVERAHRIAKSLELGIAIDRGVTLGPGARFYRSASIQPESGETP
ncbi:MAG: hypothetical protein U1E97_08540 [Alphaproteobacteria bacterium]